MNEQTTDQLQLILRMHRWKTAFFGLVILLAGLIIGASAALMYRKPPERTLPQGIESVNDRTLAALQQELQLDPAQRERIRAIFAKHFKAIEDIRTEARPRIARHMNALYEEVFSVLDGPQRDKWRQSMDRLGEDLAGRRQQRGPRGPGYGPGRGAGPGPGGRGPMRRPFDYWEQQQEGRLPYGPRRTNPQGPPAPASESASEPVNDPDVE
ncbi:MAG: periplasmic heavy metal sensor [Phycisphaerae bacterium]|nr:periplasmic heavy metal sensor [Phycisphaerae bacterium]